MAKKKPKKKTCAKAGKKRPIKPAKPAAKSRTASAGRRATREEEEE